MREKYCKSICKWPFLVISLWSFLDFRLKYLLWKEFKLMTHGVWLPTLIDAINVSGKTPVSIWKNTIEFKVNLSIKFDANLQEITFFHFIAGGCVINKFCLITISSNVLNNLQNEITIVIANFFPFWSTEITVLFVKSKWIRSPEFKKKKSPNRKFINKLLKMITDFFYNLTSESGAQIYNKWSQQKHWISSLDTKERSN